jgi:hypothetical protein
MTGFVNPDDRKDILLLFGPPRDAVGILYGRGNGAFSDSVDWIQGIRPIREDVVLLGDLDGDGTADLAWLDGTRAAALVAYQRPQGGFLPPAAVVPAKGATGMAIASLREPREHDLILAWGQKGIVSVTFNAFRRQP